MFRILALAVAAAALPMGATTTAPVSLPVYYVGAEDIPLEGGGVLTQPKLYREFHRLAAGDGSTAARVRAAVVDMLAAGSALDPDYSSHWPATTRVRAVSVADTAVTVDLSGAATNGVGSELAARTLQQLVWTVTAVSGKPGVRLLLDGVAVHELWGVLAVPDVLRRESALANLALTWLISPQYGERVGKTFRVHVAGMLPESTAYLRVRRGSVVVLERFVTLSGGAPAQGQAMIDLTLPSGQYTIEAYGVSLADGRQMSVDDHVITVA